MLKSALFLTLFLFSMALHATEDGEERPQLFGARSGYLQDVGEERTKVDIEMVMLDPPKDPGPPLNAIIFNEKLSREFKEQYQYRFGQTTTEQAINNPSRSDGYSYYTGETLTIQRYQEEQQNFGEYMTRRLVEFHVDNWAKNDPDLHAVYEFKDKVSNVNVKVAKYKFKWKYNLSGPHMDFMLENPYDIEVKLRSEMTGVISAPNEMILTLGYQINPKNRMQFLARKDDGLYQLVWMRRLTERIWGSLTGSTDTKAYGPTVQQDLILVGLGWSD